MLTREQFTAALTAIEEQITKDREKTRLLGLVFPDSHLISWDNDTILNAFIQLLSEQMGLDSPESINWYLWDNKFCPSDGCNTVYFNDSDYTINTPSDLYDFILLDKNGAKC